MRIALLVLILFAAAPGVVRGAESPSNDVIIGHFGEAIALPYGWMAEPAMHDGTEIVHIHKRTHKLVHTPQGTGYELDIPPDSDYRPENFTPRDLMQLIAAPKDAPGGYRNLDDLRQAKARELAARGIVHKIEDNCGFGQRFSFPPGSFQVWIDSPYRLYQCYTASPEAIFILSSGDPRPAAGGSLAIASALDGVQRSLEKSLAAVNPPKPADIDRRAFKDLWKLWLAVSAFFILLMLVPGTGAYVARLNAIGYDALLFFNSAFLMGFLIPAAAYHYNLGTRIFRNSGDMAVFPIILAPLILRQIARRSRGTDGRRTLMWAAGAAVLFIAICVQDHFEPFPGAADVILGSTLICSLAGIVFGIVLALTAPGKTSKSDT